jgi:hypothetical protein
MQAVEYERTLLDSRSKWTALTGPGTEHAEFWYPERYSSAEGER